MAVVQRAVDALAPVERLAVRGDLVHVDRRRLAEGLRETLDGGFFTADLAALRRRAQAEPWVSRVRVQRQWPATIEVVVSEHRPLAIYRGEGAPRLVSRQGKLFKAYEAGSDPEGLPMLAGSRGELEALTARLRSLRKALPEPDVRVVAVDARGAWTVELVEGVTVRFGREQWPRRLRRLGRVNERWGLVRPGVERIDLRYPSGMAMALTRAEGRPSPTPQTHTGPRRDFQQGESAGRAQGGEGRL
jgi:cell division protein FtsQ